MDILFSLVFRLVFTIPLTRGLIFTIAPALLLLAYVRKKDQLEPEPPKLIWQLFGLGALSVALGYVLEIGMEIVGLMLFGIESEYDITVGYRIFNWFINVALVEEGCKFLMLRLRTWRDPNFNCLYDGMVYSVAVSAGFALAENFIYLFRIGLDAMFLRAILSVPSHICFAVFMGTFYSSARKYAYLGNRTGKRVSIALALIVPIIAHGLYDYIASGAGSLWSVFLFALAMFVICFIQIKRLSGNDTFIETARIVYETSSQDVFGESAQTSLPDDANAPFGQAYPSQTTPGTDTSSADDSNFTSPL